MRDTVTYSEAEMDLLAGVEDNALGTKPLGILASKVWYRWTKVKICKC